MKRKPRTRSAKRPTHHSGTKKRAASPAANTGTGKQRRPTRGSRARSTSRRPTPATQRTSPKRSSPRRTRSKATARVALLLEALGRAQRELSARGTDLLAVANQLGHEAVQAFRHDLVNALIEDVLLDDWSQLRSAQLPDHLQLVPEATLQWFARHLDIIQHLDAGQIIEIDDEDLPRFDVEGDLPEPDGTLRRLRILKPGWKHGGHIIRRPRAILIAQGESDPAQHQLPPLPS